MDESTINKMTLEILARIKKEDQATLKGIIETFPAMLREIYSQAEE